VDSQRLVQRPVERSAVITELLPQPLLRLSLNEVGRRHAGMLPLLLRTCRGAAQSSGSGVRRRGPGTISRAPSAAPSRPLTTSAPVRGSGADAGRLAHGSQAGGGTSSSGTSTTAARGLPAAAGAVKVDGAATATAMVAIMTIATCCGSTTIAGYRGSATVAACCGSVAINGCRGSVTIAACCAFEATTARSGSVAVAACCGSEAAAAPCEPSLSAVTVPRPPATPSTSAA
jgi:hypothetical protein